MSISAINCSPLKPQVSFGNADKQYKELTDKAIALEDSFQPEQKDPEKKSKLGTLISLGTAALVTYAGGKFAADKFASAFEKQAGKLNGLLNKAGTKVAEESTKILSGKQGKIADIAGKASGKVVNLLSGEKALINVAGIASLAAFFPQLATIDGNKDGVNDISQRQVSAYKSLMENMGVVSDIAKIIA